MSGKKKHKPKRSSSAKHPGEKLNPPCKPRTISPTEQKGLDYLNNRGAACPHCNGSIEGGSMNFEAGEICQRVYCTDCQEKWQDVYKLTAVVTEDGELIASIPIPEEKR